MSQTLKVGMPAPQLKVGSWIKGGAVEKFKTGHIYVVEFWATWCKPCIEAIPSLTKYAKKYKGKVTVIGMNVFDQNSAGVIPFVEKMGDQMDYHVATDQKERPTDKHGFMSKNWVDAAKAQGIPFTVIIGKTGLVEYVGGSDLRSVLPQMIDGSWTVISDDDWLKSPLGAKRAEIDKLLSKSETYPQAIKELDEYAKMQGAGRDLYPNAWSLAQKNLVYLWLNDSDGFRKTSRELFEYNKRVPDTYLSWASMDRADLLNNVIVWGMVDPTNSLNVKIAWTKEDYEFALEVAKKVVELKPDEPGLIDSRAWAYYHTGDYENAQADFDKARKLAPEDEAILKSYELFKSKIAGKKTITHPYEKTQPAQPRPERNPFLRPGQRL